MKATTTAIDLAKTSSETLKRVHAAVEEATKRLSELSNHPEVKLPRIATAITQIQEAMKFADVTRKTVTKLASAGLAMQPQAQIELTEIEVMALAYGVLPDGSP